MIRSRLVVVPALLSAALLCGAAFAQTGHGEAASAGAPETDGILSLLPSPAKTEHTVTIAGRTLSYEAEAGTVSLLSGEAKVTAKVFYVAYDLKPATGASSSGRPITFVFNGGPGAAAAYLQLGALGPRVLPTSDNGAFLEPPQALKDNPDTWLDMTDLVFVDPVGTGYSRAAPGGKDSDFWGVKEDAAAMGAFIRLYLGQANRTASPVYLVGESYGGFRAALLARTLQEDNGISPSGIVLISPALEFSFVYPDEFKPVNWALTLPAMAAVNLEKEGVHGDALAGRLAEVEHYALSDYLVALASGLEAGGKAASDTVARDTGLPLAIVEQHFGRIPLGVFAKEFDRAGGKVLSRYDGSVETADIAPEASRDETPDAVLDRSVPVLTSAFVDYLRSELNYRTAISYRLLNEEVSRSWDYGTTNARQGYAGVLDDLQEARALNPALSVLIVNGYTDLVTPYLASRYLVAQLPTLPDTKPIRTRVYEGGHMMYLRPDSRHALKMDAAALYGDAS